MRLKSRQSFITPSPLEAHPRRDKSIELPSDNRGLFTAQQLS